jgi:hypothetical protein
MTSQNWATPRGAWLSVCLQAEINKLTSSSSHKVTLPRPLAADCSVFYFLLAFLLCTLYAVTVGTAQCLRCYCEKITQMLTFIVRLYSPTVHHGPHHSTRVAEHHKTNTILKLNILTVAQNQDRSSRLSPLVTRFPCQNKQTASTLALFFYRA